MFTGLVEALGEVVYLERKATGMRLRISAPQILFDVKTGDSISVSGVCLTALDLADGAFTADLAPETLARTALGSLEIGHKVNLERSLAANGRLGGHILQGHVDGLARLAEVKELGDGNWWLTVELPPELERYVVFKGSIALDGISLTVAAVDGPRVSAAIIPHTWENTTLRCRAMGDSLHVEVDIIAKYVEKLLSRLTIPQPGRQPGPQPEIQ